MSDIARLDSQDTIARDAMWKSTLRRLWKAPNARVGGALVLVMVLIAVLVPILDSDYDPRSGNLRDRYEEPDCIVGWFGALTGGTLSEYEFTCEYPMGADKTGKDIMQRVGHGMSVSLIVSLLVVAFALVIGTSIGLIAGFYGGLMDSIFMRGIDIMLAFPALLLAIVLVAALQGTNISNLFKGMIAISITQIPIYARLARSMAISIRETEYVMAARSLGASNSRLIRHYVLPNSLSPLIVQSTLLMGTAVIETAALGFLGLGQQPPHPELGKMLADSQQSMQSGKWWVMAFPGLAIVLIVLGFNLLGDGLRDALDPRLNK
jgi:peptide/nickel transport system permease protein